MPRKKVHLTICETPPQPMSKEEHDRLIIEATEVWSGLLLQVLKKRQSVEGGSIPTIEMAREAFLYWQSH